MTEAAVPKIPAGHDLVQVRHYEAGPPEGLELVEPGETFATTKEEEWVSKKKTELLTTRQIETRVKRQVVLEDGKVVEDSGPIVTTNTSEDTEKQEHAQTELRKLGGDEVDNPAAIEGGVVTTDGKVAVKGDWVPCPNPDGVVREVKERRVISREETEETKETEDIHHLGDITDEDFLAAVHSGESDIRNVLREKRANGSQTVVSTGPRIVHESTKKRKVTDTEDTAAISSVRPDGKIVTETTRTTEHEEVKDDELPEDAPDVDELVENSQRYQKTKDQEFVEYLADGVKIGQEMRYKAETMEGERHGDGLEDLHDWDSLSTRIRRDRRQQMNTRFQSQKLRGIEEQAAPPLDRKDALTRKPLDFDEEEETRKAETSKWLEHHFGSESTRSSRDSIDEDDAPQQSNSKSFFNVTIKSQTSTNNSKIKLEPVNSSPRPYVAAAATTTPTPQRVYSPSPEPERIITTAPVRNGYFQGISEWSERKHDEQERVYRSTLNGNGYTVASAAVAADRNLLMHRASPSQSQSPIQRSPLYREEVAPTPPERKRAVERRQRSSQDSNRYDSGYRTHSRNEMSHDEPQDEPPPDYSPPPPSPPPMPGIGLGAKKSYQRTRFATDQSPLPATPPPPPPPSSSSPHHQKPTKHSGNIIGQSIRKLVGKIRSASAERKARQRAKRSPSPQTTYQQYNVIDNIPSSTRRTTMAEHNGRQPRRGHSPVQRYYLGEDPFGGSIYGRENKYDGVKPARNKHRIHQRVEDEVVGVRSHSTLGRFSKSTGRLVNDSTDYTRTSQTLPRNIRTENSYRSTPQPPPTSKLSKSNQSNSTINVSIINTVSPNRPIANGGPAKPARTYKSHLARSKSFNVHGGVQDNTMYKSNPQLHRLDENPIGLKSPGIVSSLTRSTRDLTDSIEENRAEHSYTSRYSRNGGSGAYEQTPENNKKVFLKGLKERAPELYKTLQSDEEEYHHHHHQQQQQQHSARRWQQTPTPNNAYSTPLKSSRIATYNHGDMYEPPTRLVSNEQSSYVAQQSPVQVQQPLHSVVRRGSNSTDDYSETYHTTTRNTDPKRPSVTDTVHTVSKKTVPTKDGRTMQTIESTETKSITRSRFRGEPTTNVKYLENSKLSNSSNGGVIIEVKNYRN